MRSRITVPASSLALCLAFAYGMCSARGQAPGEAIPRLESTDGHFAMVVDGKPFLMLGAQINNSSSWPGTLPEVWPSLTTMGVNTVEAPVYWEQIEREPNHFDFANVDLLVRGAREHGLRLVLLWFGTWKNGQAHYVPEWVKTDPQRFPREVSAYGKLLDVLSPNAPANVAADAHAFAALMQHVRQIDEAQRTVILVQVENESGSIGAVRDFSPAAQKQFDAQVPTALTKRLGRHDGTWREVFGADADERFAAYSTASYINQVARAGKAEYPLPMYCNVWITYPVHALENRDHPSPGQEYPSGGPQQGNIAIWKEAAPAIDVLAPDFYSDDFAFFREVVATYRRPDNALLIPETGRGDSFGRYLFYALGQGAIGFAPFGVDNTGWSMRDGVLPASLAKDVVLLRGIAPEIAALNLHGAVQTAVEEKGRVQQRLRFGAAEAVVSFGYPQRDGEMPPGTPDQQGRALIAQLGPLEFLVTGFDASVRFEAAGTGSAEQGEASQGEPSQTRAGKVQMEILSAEEGHYSNGVWQSDRIWNGDQTDRGLNFPTHNKAIVRIRLHALPLYVAGR